MSERRVVLCISLERMAALKDGKTVLMTQGDVSYECVPQMDCCTDMKQYRSTIAARKAAKSFRVCPFCSKPIPVNGDVVRKDKRGLWCKGRKRSGVRGAWGPKKGESDLQ